MANGMNVLLVSLFLIAATAGGAAAENPVPEKLDIPSFAVATTDGEGSEKRSFSRSNPPFLHVNFALALSASNRYATTITLILEGGGTLLESVLFQGTLEEGVYDYLVPVGALPTEHGEIRAKVVVKNRVFPRKFTGESYYVYRQWEDTFQMGR